MIQLITHHDRSQFPRELAQMYADRKRVFVDRLGWDVPVVGGELEMDQFDTEEAVYVVALDRDGRHLGSARLLPSTGPHLLGDVFPHLCEDGVPRGPDTWELSRMVTAPGVDEPRLVRRRVIVGMIEYALLNGIRRFTLVTHMPYLSHVLSVGWDCEPLGLPQQHEGLTIGAMVINVTPDTLMLMRGRAQLSGPVLRWEVRDAA